MSLVEQILDNLDQDIFSDLLSVHDLSPSEAFKAVAAIIPGILAAVKAQIVSGGNLTSLLDIFQNIFDIESDHIGEDMLQGLFNNNDRAINAIVDHVEAVTTIDRDVIQSFLPSSIPLILGGLFSVLEQKGFHRLFEGQATVEKDDFIGGGLFDEAVQAANKFINSVFGKDVTGEQNLPAGTPNLMNELLAFISNGQENNDVLDNVYKILVKE